VTCAQDWRQRIETITTQFGDHYTQTFNEEAASCILSRMFGAIELWPATGADPSDFRCRASDVVAAALHAVILSERVPDDSLKQQVRPLFELEAGSMPPKGAWKAWEPILESIRSSARRAKALFDLSPEHRWWLTAIVTVSDAISTLASQIDRPLDERTDKPREFHHAGVLVRSTNGNDVDAVGVLRDKSPAGCCAYLFTGGSDRAYQAGARFHVSLLHVRDGSMMPSGSHQVLLGQLRARRPGGDLRVGMRLSAVP